MYVYAVCSSVVHVQQLSQPQAFYCKFYFQIGSQLTVKDYILAVQDLS